MKSYSSKEIIKILIEDGWFEYNSSTGSHHGFKHPYKKGKVTVSHPTKDLPIGTVKNIFSQAQIEIKKKRGWKNEKRLLYIPCYF